MAATKVSECMLVTSYSPIKSSWSTSDSSTQRMHSVNCSLFSILNHHYTIEVIALDAGTYLFEKLQVHYLKTFVLYHRWPVTHSCWSSYLTGAEYQDSQMHANGVIVWSCCWNRNHVLVVLNLDVQGNIRFPKSGVSIISILLPTLYTQQLTNIFDLLWEHFWSS